MGALRMSQQHRLAVRGLDDQRSAGNGSAHAVAFGDVVTFRVRGGNVEMHGGSMHLPDEIPGIYAKGLLERFTVGRDPVVVVADPVAYAGVRIRAFLGGGGGQPVGLAGLKGAADIGESGEGKRNTDYIHTIRSSVQMAWTGLSQGSVGNVSSN